jgi:hypothetical protein
MPRSRRSSQPLREAALFKPPRQRQFRLGDHAVEDDFSRLDIVDQIGSLGILSLDEALGGTLGGGEVRVVVLRAGCSYRQKLEVLLAHHGITVRRQLEFGTLEAIFGCVAAGLGITLLPRALLGPVWTADRVSVHSLPPAEARVETVFIRRRDAFVSSALKAFLETAKGLLEAAEAA